jgi:hypothetical protein
VGATSTGAAEEVIGTPCPIPANTLSRDGISKVRAVVKWQKAANTNSTIVRIRWAAAGSGLTGTVMATTTSAGNDVGSTLSGTGTRITSTTQRLSSDYQLANTSSQVMVANSGALDLTAATEIAVTVQGVAAGDGKIHEVSVQVLN